jgi:hypothetical protein
LGGTGQSALCTSKVNVKRLILLIFLLTAACDIAPDEESILDKSSCVLPCWNGIAPGQTTEAEFLEILQNLPNIDRDSIKDQYTSEGNIFDKLIFFSFRQGWTLNQRPKLHGEAAIIENTVSSFTICGAINTSMDRLAEQVGKPEHIISGNNFYGGRLVILIDSEEGVRYSYITELDKLEITPETRIDCIDTFDPLISEKMLAAGYFSNGDFNAEQTLSVWYPWDGYGNLDEKYPPRQPK